MCSIFVVSFAFHANAISLRMTVTEFIESLALLCPPTARAVGSMLAPLRASLRLAVERHAICDDRHANPGRVGCALELLHDLFLIMRAGLNLSRCARPRGSSTPLGAGFEAIETRTGLKTVEMNQVCQQTLASIRWLWYKTRTSRA